jgi:lambda family phage minor tail protein L
MASIQEQVQKLSAGELIELYQLDITALGGQTYHFTSSVNGANPVEFDGVTFTPIDLETSGWEWNGQGAAPRPRLKIANTSQLITVAVIEFKDLVGGKVTRIRTFKRFLDGQPDADPSAIFPVDIYSIERKVTQNKVFIEWELSMSLDQSGKKLPGRQILRDACTHRYRVYNPETAEFDYTEATCPYSGTAYFNDVGQQVFDASRDRCGKRLSDCRKRFGSAGVLPTRAFPGVARL